MTDNDRQPIADARLALARRLVELQEAGTASSSSIRVPKVPGLEEVADDVQPIFDRHVSLERHRELRAAVYAESLEESELRELVAFFETPAAHKFWRLQREVGDRFMASVADEMAAHRDELEATYRERFRKRALASGIPWTDEERRLIERTLEEGPSSP